LVVWNQQSTTNNQQLTVMQIDFHHGVTYVVARLAGFEHKAASIIAYCAQYSNLAPGNMDVKTTTTCKVGKVFNIE